MRIVASLCRTKRAGRDCEDGFALTPHFAAVADGSTSKLPAAEQPVPTGGRRAMLAVTAALQSLPAEADVAEAVRHFTEAIYRAYPDEAARRRAEAEPAHRYTCSAAVFSRRRREVWLIGDCQCRFAGRTHTAPKAIDAALAAIRADVLRYLMARGHSAETLRRTDPGRAFILPALREQLFFQNDTNPHNAFAYTVLDGFRVNAERIPVLHIGTAQQLILASDGYPALCDTLQATEEKLQRALADDPLCIDRLCGTKGVEAGAESFDDRTFLHLDLSAPFCNDTL